MGDIRRQRKKYQGPSHPWQKKRLDMEKPLVREYALVNKKEIWRMNSIARDIAQQAKKLIAQTSEQAEKEKKQLLGKLYKLSLMSPDTPIEEALGIELKDVLERRLQTQVFRKNLAKTMKQARQMIIHSHIKVNEYVVTSPSYMVSAQEELQLSYAERSPFTSEMHPERNSGKPKEEPVKEETEKKPAKAKKKKAAKQEEIKAPEEKKEKTAKTEPAPETKTAEAQEEKTEEAKAEE